MKVALHSGQLLQPVPGGIGRYTHSLLRVLPRAGVETVAFAAGARPPGVPKDFISDFAMPKYRLPAASMLPNN